MLREHVGVAAGNGLFAVIGQSGSGTGWSIRTSPDGITWTERATGATGYFAGIVYGAGRGFAAVGSRTGSTTTMGIALTSPDGITWTAQPDATTSIDTTILALTSGGGLFVAVGFGGAIFTSPTGALAFGDGKFLSAGLGTSTDGVNWTQASPLPDLPVINAGIFTAVRAARRAG